MKIFYASNLWLLGFGIVNELDPNRWLPWFLPVIGGIIIKKIKEPRHE